MRTYHVWYGVLVLLALAPVGLRALSWRSGRNQPADPEMAEAGKALFKHEWKPRDPLSPGGDGLGPVYNAASCVACHSQGGLGGSGGVRQNVTAFTVNLPGHPEQAREGVVHAFATKYQETL